MKTKLEVARKPKRAAQTQRATTENPKNTRCGPSGQRLVQMDSDPADWVRRTEAECAEEVGEAVSVGEQYSKEGKLKFVHSK